MRNVETHPLVDQTQTPCNNLRSSYGLIQIHEKREHKRQANNGYGQSDAILQKYLEMGLLLLEKVVILLIRTR